MVYGRRSLFQEAKKRNYQRKQLFGETETFGGGETEYEFGVYIHWVLGLLPYSVSFERLQNLILVTEKKENIRVYISGKLWF